MSWSIDDIPEQTGRIAIVTGANSGIGFETAKALAGKGAAVIMACRDLDKGRAALDVITDAHPDATVELMRLDLGELASIRSFAEAFAQGYPRLDLLVNNAGVMVPPRGETAEGFETQFGTNHLGHFALTGLLLPLLEASDAPRVVNVSSMAHKFGRMDFDNLNAERRYQAWPAYGQSKLANLLFTRELNRRADGTGVTATAAHPGWTATNLQGSSAIMRLGNALFAQAPPQGALPTLRAATDPQASADDYFGPGGFFEVRGAPVPVQPSAAARDEVIARKLWSVSEALTGVHYLSPEAG
jgi:NAD(P)-dependent dehydrogenase (short-subunit alcohol dehydrogenase family)